MTNNEKYSINDIDIIYEDNHLLVIVKPVNMPVQADSSGDADCLNLLKAYIKEKYNKPGEAYLGLVHRLDRPVGGVMVFARTTKAASRLSEQIRSRTMQKTYYAVVEGIAKAGQRENWLVKDEKTRMSFTVDETCATNESSKARRAVLNCFPMEFAEKECLTLCRIELETGRHHQIRVQMAASGTPVWGDARYGKGIAGRQIALWAHSLTFEHPTKRELMTFTACPRLYPFTLFSL